VLTAQAEGGGSLLGVLFLPAMLMVVFYLLVFRPQATQAARAKEFRAGLKAGDRVITAGGFYGTIAEFEGEVVVLETAPRVRMRIRRDQIAEKQPEPAGGGESSAKE
jgi:preprotein translocase subunit YajC